MKGCIPPPSLTSLANLKTISAQIYLSPPAIPPRSTGKRLRAFGGAETLKESV